MAAGCYTIFDTALGPCGIAWGGRGIVAIQLPEASESRTRGRLLRHHSPADESAPPTAVAEAIGGIVALLGGEKRDLAQVVLDMNHVPDFSRRVYEVARTIPPGSCITYGEVAARLGDPGAARAVGQALGRNAFPIIVPCHRVLAAGGKLGGFSGNGGVTTKLRLLSIEGWQPEEVPVLFADLPLAARAPSGR